MKSLTAISDTLFIPVGGRIYASENFPEIFYDREALKLKPMLPEAILKYSNQSQYTFMASVSRCVNLDNTVREFLDENPLGIIVELGCGLETTYFRTDNGRAAWYELDLPEVIELREKLIPAWERVTYIKSSVFEKGWIGDLKKNAGNRPILFVAGGLFHYFREDSVIELLRDLCGFPKARIVFDAVSKTGMKRTKKYMRQMGHDCASMYFYCGRASLLASKISPDVTVISEKNFYSAIDKTALAPTTRLLMTLSDLFGMVKIIELRLS